MANIETITTDVGIEVIKALNKMFSNPENYCLVVYGDGSGHFEDTADNHIDSFSTWEELGDLALSEEAKTAKDVLVPGTRVKLTGGRYMGEQATVERFTAYDGFARVAGTSYGDGYWEHYRNIEVLPKFAVKDSITYQNERSVHDGDNGIILSLTGNTAKLWLSCDTIIDDVPFSCLTKK